MRFLAIIVLAALVSISMTSCEGSGSSGKSASGGIEHPEGLIFPLNEYKGGDYGDMNALRNTILSLINHRSQKEPKPPTMISYGVYEPVGVYNDGKMSKAFQYKGYWIDFGDDYTYKYGYFDNVQGGGRYHISFEDETLYTVDNDTSIEPKVWGVIHNGVAMAVSGRHDFGINNGMQIKMEPADNRPVRPSKR